MTPKPVKRIPNFDKSAKAKGVTLVYNGDNGEEYFLKLDVGDNLHDYFTDAMQTLLVKHSELKEVYIEELAEAREKIKNYAGHFSNTDKFLITRIEKIEKECVELRDELAETREENTTLLSMNSDLAEQTVDVEQALHEAHSFIEALKDKSKETQDYMIGAKLGDDKITELRAELFIEADKRYQQWKELCLVEGERDALLKKGGE